MKELLLYLHFILLPSICFSQTLEGDWKGKYYVTSNNGYSTPFSTAERAMEIKLRFILNKDSSYIVFSYSGGRNSKNEDTTVICNVVGQLTPDSVYLEEIELLMPKDISPMCFQKMYLRIIKRKKMTELRGLWKSESPCNSEGTISFWKKNEE